MVLSPLPFVAIVIDASAPADLARRASTSATAS